MKKEIAGSDAPQNQFRHYIGGAIITKTDGSTEMIETISNCEKQAEQSITEKVKRLKGVRSYRIYICAVMLTGQRTGRYFVGNNISSSIKIAL